jgi:mannose-1-phosphate guanylyltransferase
MAVLTADHQIGAPGEFRATVEAALDFAAAEPALVTIGVRPTRPDTGYGYIEIERAVEDRELQAGSPAIRPVLHFREKPDRPTAEQYAASGRHLWNAGMFFWRVSTFLDGLAIAMPELHVATADMVHALEAGAPGQARLARTFESLEDISIDYGLIERAGNVHVIPATFPWDDVGSWDSLTRTREADENGNVETGGPIMIDVRNSVVYDDTNGHVAVAVVGLEDVIVATTPDGVLVCRKDRAQDVKKAVAELRRRGRERFT